MQFEGLLFAKIELEKVFKILKIFDESQAPGIYDPIGIFLKDGASFLATPVTQLCNLSISSGRIPDDCKIAKLKLPSILPPPTYVKSAGENNT